MERTTRLAGRRRRTWLLIGVPSAVLLISLAGVLGSGAIFTSTSANPSNVFTAGILKHTNSKDASAILTAEKMKPTGTADGSVTITNDGDIPGTFSLSTSELSDTPGVHGGELSDVLELLIVDEDDNEIYNGAIDAVGDIDLGEWAVDDTHTYDFTVTFPDGGTPGGNGTGDNAYKGSSMSIQFDWTVVQ